MDTDVEVMVDRVEEAAREEYRSVVSAPPPGAEDAWVRLVLTTDAAVAEARGNSALADALRARRLRTLTHPRL